MACLRDAIKSARGLSALNTQRYDRYHTGGAGPDQRNAAQRDRDRIIHSSALRRLGGVTQVVDPSEGYVFHNRLTHTLKVAQIARRLAEKLSTEQKEVAELWGEIEPEVVEAAALAHDLGHPPFGHVAEDTLDRLIVKEGDADGFEGNPQSFRIINKLAVRRVDSQGLNLTRASLGAMLKYPWFRETSGDRSKKWGAYHTEEEEFLWARKLFPPSDDRRSAEAELMDWADDIAYAVHDMEDFYRAGFIPLHLLVKYEDERNAFLSKIESDLENRVEDKGEAYSKQEMIHVFHDLMCKLPIGESYIGSRSQRGALRACTGNLIRQYVFGIHLNPSCSEDDRAVVIERRYEMEIFLLKQLTRYFVIGNPSLAAQQYGKAKIITTLFNELLHAATTNQNWASILPIRCREDLANLEKRSSSTCARVIADVVSSLSDREALSMYRHFTGIKSGAALEILTA